MDITYGKILEILPFLNIINFPVKSKWKSCPISLNPSPLYRPNTVSFDLRYNQAWVFDNSMGPNPLWLLEWLVRDMKINKDMTVLDMGCGKALTSIFLAKEFGCTVFATDVLISPDDNLERIRGYSLQSKVFPIQAEAHALPYAKEFFDAITCIDSYNNYGTDDLYLNYFSKFVKPGGQIGIAEPGWIKETLTPMPPGLN